MTNLFRLLASPSLRTALAVSLFISAMTIIATGSGCSNSSTNSPIPSAASATPTIIPSGASPTPTPTAAPQIFVSMSLSATATTDPTYGVISGYGVLGMPPTASPVPTPAPAQIIMVPMNETIVFLNFDRSQAHTASLLGPANGMNWPPTFTNNNGASGFSPAGSPITTSDFSTGTVPASGGLPSYSFIYNTGSVTGMFYFGDFFDYLSNPPFRTVIIVQ